MASHGKVMEFHNRATVGSLFMFDMGSWVYFCPCSDRVPCRFLSHSASVSSHICTPCSVPETLCFLLSLSFPATVFLPLSFSATLMCSVVFPALLFSLCSLRFNSLSPSCRAEKWTMICIQRTPGNWSRVMTMYSHCVCVCVCAHAKQLGPLRAFCLPVSFCYWCHISPGTHTTSSQLLVRRLCVWLQERRAHGALNHYSHDNNTTSVARRMSMSMDMQNSFFRYSLIAMYWLFSVSCMSSCSLAFSVSTT